MGHQEDLGQSGCGGYQEVRGGAERRRSSAPRLPRQKHKSLQGKVLMLRPVRTQFYFKISEYVVNIYEISVGFTFYVEQISVNLHKFVYGMLCSQTNKQTTGSMESLFLPVYKHHK